MTFNTFRANSYAVIAATSDGANTVIAAPGAGRAILVLSYQFRVVGAGDITISGLLGGGTIPFTGAASPGLAYSASGNSEDIGVLRCAANTALTFTNAAGVDATGTIVYRVIDA